VARRRKRKTTDTPPDPSSPIPSLERIARLLALLLVRDRPNQKEQISVLKGVGYPPAEIAAMLGTTAHTVSVELSGMKKARGGNRGGGKKKRKK
jgi:hypothetical protein